MKEEFPAYSIISCNFLYMGRVGRGQKKNQTP